MPAYPDLLDNPFRRRLAQPGAPLGTWLMSGAASTAEAMGRAGFDWLLVDLEHVPMDEKDTLAVLQAIAGTDACPVARLAANEAVLFKRALDLGAQTVMVPFVDSADAAARAVSYAKYPPQGVRGFAAVHRASGYGTARDYGQRANDSVFTIIQLETPQAVAALEEIAAVPGVDALFLGPGDLSANMGHIGNIAHPDVQAVIADVAKRCRAVGKPCGIVGPTPQMVGSFVQLGYDFVAVASDMGMMMRQATAFIEAIRPSLAKGFESSVY
ncbi:HpcH/HpaI aldolase/citrate lyase family protein [Pseudacidovorax sp. RU35E]|uniref:HpcH/HpaI aldolase family protein n=1 Tax=Pseudacidovorax sp. RU35E TaxID=1907403 RepID=UPI000955F047|nr:aldolase/citrate lyase family protein [Pseudacidovorax sp. RU35E]SIQ53742.1 2-dehydro-3-deoxyglucarate aldolase/4-hydroxy-2-oxoheptanedioate aldolase [Pseudacidovorax sp. RU35E]